MSLLEDLRGLDVSAITDARVSVSASLEIPQLQQLLGEGGISVSLGPLNDTLSSLQGSLDNPEQLLEPLLEGILNLAQQLGLDQALVDTLLEQVGDGAGILKAVLEGLAGDPGALAIGGSSAGGAFAGLTGALGDYATRSIGGLGRTRAMLNLAENGIPGNPAGLAEAGLELLLPFPRQALTTVKGQVDALNTGIAAIRLPTGRVEGLNAAFGRVAAAARAGNTAELQAELNGLEALHRQAVSQIGADLRAVQGRIEGLQLPAALASVAEAARSLKTPEVGGLELMDRLRGQLGQVEGFIAQADPNALEPFIDQLFDYIENDIGGAIERGIDDQIARLENWLRGLLRELPLQSIRDQLSAALASVVDAIEGADIDRAAEAVRGAISQLDDLLAAVDLQALLDQAAQALADAIRQALDALEAALAGITAAIEAIAGQAQAILQRAVAGLASFREAFNQVTVLIESIDLEGATQQVIQALSDLRQKAEQLLSVAPLPEELRPVVDQLVAKVEAIDLDAVVRAPLDEVARTLQIPPDIADTVNGGLEQIAEKVSNLIPAQLGAELQAELDGLLGRLSELNLDSLSGVIGGALDQIAGAIDQVDPVAIAQPAADAFQTALQGFDRLKPSTLLQPAINAYDNLLGELPIPDATGMASRVGEVTSNAGELAARAATAPMRSIATPPGGREPASTSPRDEAPAGDPPPTVRPGDLIRVFAFVPQKLREALTAIDRAGAGEALQAMQALCGGLATQLRGLEDAIYGLEGQILADLDAMAASVSAAQAEAQLSLSGDAGSLRIVASAGGLRAALEADIAQIRALVSRTLTGLGSGAGSVAEVAECLEECRLASIGDDLDALLDALDPEPLAAQMDQIFAVVVNLAHGLLPTLETQIREIENRTRLLIERFNPGAQAQKLLRVLTVLKEQLDLLNPRRLADELDEIHAAIRASLAAYDPAVFASDLAGLLATAKATITSLDPANLTPDLTPIEAQIQRVPGLLPLEALQGIGTELTAVGEELRALDVDGMVEAVNGLAPEIADAVSDAVDAIKAEIIALLNAITYANSNASASVSVSASIG